MSLGGDTITVYTESDEVTTDKLGVAIEDFTAGTTQPGCSVQRMTSSEDQSNVDRTITLRTVFADPTPLMLSVATNDRIGYAGQLYNVYGDVDHETDLNGRVEFVQFVIRRPAG